MCSLSGWGATRYGLVACGTNGNGKAGGLDDPAGHFQPCDSVILCNNDLHSYMVIIRICHKSISFWTRSSQESIPEESDSVSQIHIQMPSSCSAFYQAEQVSSSQHHQDAAPNIKKH